MMNIPKLIKEAHDIAIEREFYDCPECDDGKTIRFACYAGDHTEIIEDCDNCDGTDIDPNKNIGELLMLIVADLGKALEVHQCGRFADWKGY
ncbi:hypothetical protein KA005_14000, partial [bacterium]|nr:hypothetical protein [bacterium]